MTSSRSIDLLTLQTRVRQIRPIIHREQSHYLVFQAARFVKRTRQELQMAFGFLDIAVTPAVRAMQERLGVADMWKDFKGDRAFDRFTERESGFIGARDSMYMASTSETGWPYVQHRGGPPGFIKVMDDRTLAFADYRGNFQYISLGNLSANDKASLILVDYPRRARLKIYVHAEAVALDADPTLSAQVLDGSSAKAERIIRLRLRNFDWNCPQHIVPRYTEAELADALRPIGDRLSALEAENASLRERLEDGPP